MLFTGGLLSFVHGPAAADVRIDGRVDAGGGPLANSTVTLWAASASTPKQLAQTQTGGDGRFELCHRSNAERRCEPLSGCQRRRSHGHQGQRRQSGHRPLDGAGQQAPSQCRHQRDDDRRLGVDPCAVPRRHAIKGHALGLRIAAGNVPNFVDLQTGGWGDAIQDPLNSGQTPTMANFATLADVLAGCATRVIADACNKLFAAATPPKGDAPTDTLTAAAVDRSLSLAPARTALRPARPVLSGPDRARTCAPFRTCPI